MTRGLGSGVFSASFKGVDKKGDEIDKTVWFSFGALASAYSEAEAKMGIFDMITEISKGHGTLYFIHYFYGGAVAHADLHGLPRPTFIEVVRWMELIDENKLLDIFSRSLMSPNQEAPETGQQQQAV